MTTISIFFFPSLANFLKVNAVRKGKKLWKKWYLHALRSEVFYLTSLHKPKWPRCFFSLINAIGRLQEGLWMSEKKISSSQRTINQGHLLHEAQPPSMWKQLFSPPKSLALFLYHFCGHYYTVSYISLVIYIWFITLVTYSTSTMKLQMLWG